MSFIDTHRGEYAVEPICRELPIAASTYYEHKSREQDPSRRSVREQRDEQLSAEIEQIWQDNHCVYGVRKVWREMRSRGDTVARCTVERLMRRDGLEGAVRGKRRKTTHRDETLSSPQDKVKRQFDAERPNALWVSDFTYVSTWEGVVYTAFVIDVFARMIVGWRVARSMQTELVLDALEQAIHARLGGARDGPLIHHSDRGSQYLSICYTERLLEAGIEPSVGTVGCSYDNALAETVIGLYKTEVINRQGPWHRAQPVEHATLEWVDWFNHRRLYAPLGYIPPAEAERAFYRERDGYTLAS